MADASYLTIGKVVKKLQVRYPDLTVSKVRFLEDEGLLTPSRTPGGYRLYSPADVRRLETILHLQKTRFLPLSVIREELEKGGGALTGASTLELPDAALAPVDIDDESTVHRLHSIDRVPEQLGVSVSFVRQLADAGVITLRRSPRGRDLVDGHDFALIRTCDELRRFGIGPRNLRQYVQAANRESGMFEQALIVFARKGGGVKLEVNDDTRQEFMSALSKMLALTNRVRDELVVRRVRQSYQEMGEDAAGNQGINDRFNQGMKSSTHNRSWGHR